LKRAGIDFVVRPADIPEVAQPGETPAAFAERAAREKALAIAARLSDAEAIRVVAADTIVVLDNSILGKPSDPEEAVRQLESLLGREHSVLSGVAVLRTRSGFLSSLVVTSRVRMRRASRAEIRAYVAGGEPLDKAGSYALQGQGGRLFVTGVEGSRSNVIGLPLEETLALLERAERASAGEST